MFLRLLAVSRLLTSAIVHFDPYFFPKKLTSFLCVLFYLSEGAIVKMVQCAALRSDGLSDVCVVTIL